MRGWQHVLGQPRHVRDIDDIMTVRVDERSGISAGGWRFTRLAADFQYYPVDTRSNSGRTVLFIARLRVCESWLLQRSGRIER